IAQTGATCVLISALAGPGAALLTRQVAAAAPKSKIFASSALAQAAYVDPVDGGIPLGLDDRVLLTVATLDFSEYPPAGRAFLRAYAARYGAPQPQAIYGYEAMSLMLSAIGRATDQGTKPARRSEVV